MASAAVCSTLPKIEWPISSGATPERSIAAFDAATVRSTADTSLSEPPNDPKGVRTPERKTTSRVAPCVFTRQRPYATLRPQVVQNFHPISSSVLHAGQCCTVRFWPQCGQKTILRPAGRWPAQYRQLSGSDEAEFAAAFAAARGGEADAG